MVRPGDGRTLAEIVQRSGEALTAIDEGRVFVGKKRATRADQPVKPGDSVRIGGARKDEATPRIEMLFVQDGLAACVKPAGLPTVPDHAGAAHSLVALVAKAVSKRIDELRVTSRLDREVSGVVIFALDEAAEQLLKTARAEGRYQRRYVALATTTAPTAPLADEGLWTAPIGRAPDPRLRQARGADAKEASTRWRKIATAPASGRGKPAADVAVAMLAVDPMTGRTHQIRVHASDAGAPLLGDGDYGGHTRLVLSNGGIVSPSRIALHAARVIVPGARGVLEARAPIPSELRELWAAFGGAPEAWQDAIDLATPEGSPLASR